MWMQLGKTRKLTENELITNRILAVFISALVGVLLLMLAYQLVADAQTAVIALNTIEVLGYVGAIAVVFGVVKEILDRKKHTKNNRILFNGITIAFYAVLLSLSCFSIVYLNFISVIKFLYVVLPSLAVLYLILLIYQREFFYLSLMSSAMSALFWILSQINANGNADSLQSFLLIAAAIINVAAALLFLLLMKGSGSLSLGKKKINILPSQNGASILILTAVILAISAVVGLFIGAIYLPYISYALLSYIFVMAVYYTVKLM